MTQRATQRPERPEPQPQSDHFSWKVRFAPNAVGTWQYRLMVQDASGTTQTPPQTFQVVASSYNAQYGNATGGIINVFAHSDFGRAFRTFHRDFIAAVNNRTTVIVLGDARNNYNLAQEWVLKEVQHRAKQVIWLNPENRLTWGFGDSEMDRYLPYCDVVEECRNRNFAPHRADTCR